MKSSFLITTGGSGGHVIPATILYEHLSTISNVIITTDKRGFKYLNKDIYQFEIINTPKLNNIFLLPLNLLLVFFLTIKSFLLMKKMGTKKVFSTGGYMSLPLILAAKFLKLDIYLIEPNQVLGRANKFFLRSCKKIFCYSKEIKNFPNIFKNKIVTINPLVSEQSYKLKQSHSTNDKLTILAFPSNNFGFQEPGSNDQIEEFCETNYGIDFQLFEKSNVRGKNSNNVYKWLSSVESNGWNDKSPRWNFFKYLIDERGMLKSVLSSNVNPLDKEIVDFVIN